LARAHSYLGNHDQAKRCLEITDQAIDEVIDQKKQTRRKHKVEEKKSKLSLISTDIAPCYSHFLESQIELLESKPLDFSQSANFLTDTSRHLKEGYLTNTDRRTVMFCLRLAHLVSLKFIQEEDIDKHFISKRNDH
jgi:hypothetical protein